MKYNLFGKNYSHSITLKPNIPGICKKRNQLDPGKLNTDTIKSPRNPVFTNPIKNYKMALVDGKSFNMTETFQAVPCPCKQDNRPMLKPFDPGI